MHEVLNSMKQHPTQKLQKNFINLKNPKVYQKSQKLGQKIWNTW